MNPDRIRAAAPDDLVGHLRQLVQALDSRRAGAARSQESWSDDDYAYFEVRLGRIAAEDLDLCVHDGTVFLRVARPAEAVVLRLGDDAGPTQDPPRRRRRVTS